jgi:GalNAc5-diNAcBac-PP-undecaprenol beta-1,3-glucosyltransferase
MGCQGGQSAARDDRLVSIIMATYNRAGTIPRAIRSVLGQSYPYWELIVVDDGSTDGTDEVLAQFSDPRIKVFRHERNRGATAARNTGLEHLRGGWFTLLDSDDEMLPEALGVMVDCAARTGATAVTCNCIDSVNGALTGRGHTSDGRMSPEETARQRGEHWGITRTSLLGDLRFDERLPGFEETVWLPINRRARRYYVHRALRVYHTEGSDRLCITARRSSLPDKVRVFHALGQNRAFLAELKAVDPERYRRTMQRVWIARVLHPLLRG